MKGRTERSRAHLERRRSGKETCKSKSVGLVMEGEGDIKHEPLVLGS